MKDKKGFELQELFSLEERKENLFLGRYTISRVYSILERKGFVDFAKRKGLYPILFDLSWKDLCTQRLEIYFSQKDEKHRIVDLILKEKPFSFPISEGEEREFRFLFIEWLCLQNPISSFTKDKPRLPGQTYPGLGLGERLWNVFELLVKFMQIDGVMIKPKFLHNAIMNRKLFRFIKPEKEGELRAIMKDLGHYHLAVIAWASYHGCIFEEEKKYEWIADALVFPHNKELKEYFSSGFYVEKVKEEIEKMKFTIDLNCLRAKEPSLFE
ncbi:MAG: hypothetical protein ACUVUG_02800 [Candidatus Aminicenantia bacterium]